MSERPLPADDNPADDNPADDIGDATEDDRAAAFVGQLFGGRVVNVKRLPRRRPSWFVDVKLPLGGTVPLHLRGERRHGALPFPSLQREADILRVIEAGGVPVPHVYGICPDPLAVVMDHVAGTRAQTGTEPERRAAAEQYMALLHCLHSLAIAPFAACGIDVPDTAERIGLAVLDANLARYRRTKAGPDPLIEFAIAFVRRNIPKSRSRAAFVHGNAGRFLHAHGRITALYDFERSIIGDSMMDLAALRLRHPVESWGADLGSLLRVYQSVSGQPIDVAALRFHTVVCALVGVMAPASPIIEPQQESSELEYLGADLRQRRTLVWALAECMGVPIEPPARPTAGPTVTSPIVSMLNDSLAQLRLGTGMDRYQHYANAMLVRCATPADALGADLDRAAIDEYASILGHPLGDRRSAAAAMQRFVLGAGPESDVALVRCFASEVERMASLLGPVADQVAYSSLAPVDL